MMWKSTRSYFYLDILLLVQKENTEQILDWFSFRDLCIALMDFICAETKHTVITAM